MYGAIEFMRAWRDFCKEHDECLKCELKGKCRKHPVFHTDEEINANIKIVMRRKAQREKEARK
jgi:hypothetical protein